MKVICPKCQREIPPADVNVAADVAFCRPCNEALQLSDLVEDGEEASGAAPPPEMLAPPRGAWFEKGLDGFTVGATTRSCVALFLVPFACVWAGGSLGGIYGTQITKGQFDLVLSLFGIPFLLGSVVLIGFTLMTVAGKLTVTVRRGEGVVFVGVGPFGWRKRFNPSEVRRVREEVRRGSKGSTTRSIVLEGAERIELGSMLSEERQRFMLHVLRYLLTPDGPRRGDGSSA
jgi:hypothetical protein